MVRPTPSAILGLTAEILDTSLDMWPGRRYRRNFFGALGMTPLPIWDDLRGARYLARTSRRNRCEPRSKTEAVEVFMKH